jgi:hypothetical protein
LSYFFDLVVQFVHIHIGENWTDLSTNNVAKNVIDFSIAIPRERLRPNYGDGFLGAPLGASGSSSSSQDQDRGVKGDESRTTKEAEVDRETEV